MILFPIPIRAEEGERGKLLSHAWREVQEARGASGSDRALSPAPRLPPWGAVVVALRLPSGEHTKSN